MSNFSPDHKDLKRVPNHQRQWDDYRHINRNFQFFGIGAVICYLTFQFLQQVFQMPFYYLFLIIIFGAGLLFYIAKLGNWECPQCNEKFHKEENSGKMKIFAKKCVNCNLPKYEGSIFKK